VWLDVAGFVVAAIALVWGIYRDVAARRERRKRQELEDQLREQQEEHEAQIQRPEIIVTIGTVARSERGTQVSVVLTNKGPTLAREVTFGLRVYDEELQTVLEIPARGIDETVTHDIFLPQAVEERMLAREDQLRGIAVPWARFSDKRGREYEV